MTASRYPFDVRPGRTRDPLAEQANASILLVLGAATIATGLAAGVCFAFACAVLPGLSRGGDRTYVEAMTNMNVAIENPAFFAAFFGAPILAAVALVLQRRCGRRDGVRWTVRALALSVVAILVTMGFNLPLNDKLEKAAGFEDAAAVARAVDDFQTPWIIWNIVRTLAFAAALGCLVAALVVHARGGEERQLR